MAKIINIASDIQRSAPDGTVTYRSLDTLDPRNSGLPNKMQAVVDDAYKSSYIFKDVPVIDSPEQLQQLLSQLVIRFDTKPSNYTKKDYQLLISVLFGALGYLYDGSANTELIDQIQQELSGKQDKNDVDINFEDHSVVGALNYLLNKVESIKPQLVAGSGIQISDTTDGQEIKSIVSEPITVTGVTVGNLKPGDKVDENTDLMVLLKRILQKEIFCNFTDSSVTMPTISKTVEYGGDITINGNATLNQAKAVSQDPDNYNYSHTFNQTIEKGVGANDWTWSTVNGKLAGEKTYNKVISNISDTNLGTYTLSTVSDTDRSKSNMGTVEGHIPSTTGSIKGTVNITPTLKCYVGAVSKSTLTSADITALSSPSSINLGTKSTKLTGNFTNVLNGSNQTLCIAVPNTLTKLSAALDDMSFNQNNSFTGPTTVTVNQQNGYTYAYNVWTWKATGSTVNIKTIELS